jgi:hypothetical protein
MAETIDYRAVLADLKSRIAGLQQAASAVEAILGETGGPTGMSSNGPTVPKGIEADTFIGLNILQAAEKYLQIVGRPAKTTDNITEALNQGGLDVSAGSVSTILRRSDTGDSRVTRVGRSLWGLAEWYPGRPRRNNRQAAEETE